MKKIIRKFVISAMAMAILFTNVSMVEASELKASDVTVCCEHSEMTRYYFHELSQDFSVCWQMTYFDFKSPDYVA